MKISREQMDKIADLYLKAFNRTSEIRGPYDDVLLNKVYWLTRHYSARFRNLTYSLAFGKLYELQYRIMDISLGFVYVGEKNYHTEGIESVDGFIFGWSVLVRGNKEWPLEIINNPNSSLPIVLSSAYFIPDGPPRPLNGNSSCWVRSKTNDFGWEHGVVTCAHVIGNSVPGANISLNFNMRAVSGTVKEIGLPCIDASVIEISAEEWPQGLKNIGITSPVVPGMQVELHLPSGIVQGTVLRITGDPHYFGAHIGHRVFIDFHGDQGESGSLLSEDDNAAGIYMGRIAYTDGTGRTEGMCQNFEQVARYFELVPYR